MLEVIRAQILLWTLKVESLLINGSGGGGGGGSMSQFILEDDSGDEVTINNNKEVKFIGAGGLTINWTDISDGTDGDPYDLTFTIGTSLTKIQPEVQPLLQRLEL